ncbi:Pkinase and PKK domain containing protein [Trichuris trichiura]|uniref:Pkinase and PKK domain containing protein n=1 Tax=Trichuris trichiura TaxID=36087 RepID=A0A077ZG55_TRITR|nr:Pkinase and PKK domain containing protein [Trichuris trichiura]
MPLLDVLKNFFKSNGYGTDSKRSPAYNFIQFGVDPHDIWDVVSDLGDGAFGKVQKVIHKENGTCAAAKAIELQSEEDIDEYLVEIEILTQCHHKNVVRLYEVLTYFFSFYNILMLEFCGGGAVDSIMVELEKPLSEPQIRFVCHELCEALRFLHKCHVIHRDLKAGNILLTFEGEVKLGDFGVSAKSSDSLHRRTTFIGTPYWMAPEVMVCETFKEQPYGSKCDIWSLGITLIELAEMEPPYHEMSPMRVVFKVQKSDPPTLCNPAKWYTFHNFLSRCLVKNPNERDSADLLCLHSFVSGQDDPKPILQLLSELKADVIAEVVEEIEEEAFTTFLCILALRDSSVHVQSNAAQSALSASAYAEGLIEREVPPAIGPFLPSNSFPSNLSASVTQICPFLESHTVGKADEPPPEPPIDYETALVAKDAGQSDFSCTVLVKFPMKKRSNNIDKYVKETANGNSLLARRNPHRRTVTKKTRVFVLDGVQVTSTTYHVMSDDDTVCLFRKAELQEMRRLQKEEVRQFQELSLRAEMQRDQQSRKFEQDLQTLLREYESEVDSIMRCQKKQLEEAEKIQEDDMKIATKRLKVEEVELKHFREVLRQEHKLLKQEMDFLPKQDRKELYKQRKELLDAQQHAHALTLNRLDDSHRQKITLLERQFLQQKHQMLRAREAALWELEERQLHERHQLLKNQMKEDFFLQRSHMLVRHQKELEHVKKVNQRKEEDAIRAQTSERKRLPKILRSETKTRTMMFRESLKIRMLDPGDVAAKLREFEERERYRIAQELKKQELKHKKRMDLLRAENEATNEKRKLLLEHENLRLKLFDEEYANELKAWKAQLKPRKQKLEEKFSGELNEQERFYERTLTGSPSLLSVRHSCYT